MQPPDIDFTSIRPHDGSRHTGFEELCSQLASLEGQPVGAVFTRKGRGGDAGLECFFRLTNGDEIGWQAKYVFDWDSSLSAQLTKSVEAALSKHPKLTRLVVCLPFDLSDSRPKRGQSARQKWEAWKGKWEEAAKKQGRTFAISLWGKGELGGKLAIDRPEYTGRLLYWFGKETLTAAWFSEQFGKARASLGSRYTPDTNVELPIRKDFLAFARDPSLEATVQEWALNVAEKGVATLRSVSRANNYSAATETTALSQAIEALNKALEGDAIGPEAPYPLELWKTAVRDCYSAVRTTLTWVYSLPEGKAEHGVTDQAWARDNLFRFGDMLDGIAVALNSDQWRLANARAVLLKGAAGTGKSHLLADVVEHQVHAHRPAVLILGSAMVEGEPWPQIMAQLDLSPDLQAKQFLGMLDAAAQASGVRAVVCVDAINERHGPDIWPERLAAFLKTAEPFPRVGVVLSCRTTYVAHVVPDAIEENQLSTVVHQGFFGRGGEAAILYLAKRGIVRPGAPNLVPEFLNPLFLKTCCDFLDREGKNELPRGLRGVSAIFGFYNHAVARAVTRRMKLDPNQELVESALRRFADILVARGESYAPKDEVISALESVLSSNGSLDRSLLAQLESEGILAVEPVRQEDGSVSSMVRFTFERYSDHAIAARLLQEHLDKADVTASFAVGTRLGELTFGSENYRFSGVIEAIAIQLPENTGVEIVDLRSAHDWTVQRAFTESLLWREQAYFTDRTFKLAKHFNDEDGIGDLLVSIATEPTNKFNADYLHHRLLASPTPDRDAHWSVYLNGRGDETDAVGVLIGWAMQNGVGSIEDERARLTALVLGWFLSSSNRMVRDRATKALACIFANRLALAAATLRAFEKVDDLYVQERLFGAAYGAALQGKSTDGLAELAAMTYELVFASGSPPLNELLRDHARGIVTYTEWRGHLSSSVDLARIRPPYSSAWPIEFVPDAVIDGYKQDYNGSFYGDAIVSSVINDGDFARYVIDHKVDRWAPVLLSASECPSGADLAMEWFRRFLPSATAQQLAAFEVVIAAARAAHGQISYKETPERSALEGAERAFQETVTSDAWEEYRVTAKHYIRHVLFSDRHQDYSARFNQGWARRWICKRAHELGWTPERFATLERSSGYDRHDHRVERIGKKYQWLALGELISRMADNLLFMGASYGTDGPRPYTGAREIGLRDIDPSLLVTKTHYDGWKQWPRSWWVPVEPRLRQITPLERLAWLDSNNDLLNDTSLVDLTDPKTGRRWLPLHSFASWRQSGIDGENKEMQRETWFRVSTIVVAKKDEAKVARGLKGRIITDPHGFPEFHLDSDYYLGEFPWHPTLGDAEDWVRPDRWNKFAAPVRPTVAEYLCERGGYDYSVDDTVRIQLPAPWLAEAMELRLLDGLRPTFVDAAGVIRFFDPSVVEPGFHAALVDREAFLSTLDRQGLSAIWIIAGEKGVFGGRESHRGFGGRVLHTAVYRLGPAGFSRTLHVDREYPDEEQLKALLGEQPSVELIAQYSRLRVHPKPEPSFDNADLTNFYRQFIEGED
ncbi:MAG TPA: hypothetical protein VMG08_17240 [Allosphingosinicella sp.]|nr:hypothetical protein [Allosphingosinicella sp.]